MRSLLSEAVERALRNDIRHKARGGSVCGLRHTDEKKEEMDVARPLLERGRVAFAYR